MIEYRVGTEKDWKIHFDYLLPYFKDSRYVKHDNRILFLVYNYSDEIQKMVEYWDKLAKENGFAGNVSLVTIRCTVFQKQHTNLDMSPFIRVGVDFGIERNA